MGTKTLPIKAKSPGKTEAITPIEHSRSTCLEYRTHWQQSQGGNGQYTKIEGNGRSEVRHFAQNSSISQNTIIIRPQSMEVLSGITCFSPVTNVVTGCLTYSDGLRVDLKTYSDLFSRTCQQLPDLFHPGHAPARIKSAVPLAVPSVPIRSSQAGPADGTAKQAE